MEATEQKKPEAYAVTAGGVTRMVAPKDGAHFTYEELQEYVRGDNEEAGTSTVEILPMPSGMQLVGNENAKIIGLPRNEIASGVWKTEYPIEQYPDNNDETICGNVLITDPRFLEE